MPASKLHSSLRMCYEVFTSLALEQHAAIPQVQSEVVSLGLCRREV